MIKCFSFSKLLKQLFIILLISCFGFLVNSFVSADWIFQEVGLPFTVAGQINYTLNARPSGAGIVEGGNVIVPAFYVPKRWSSYQYYSLFYYNTDGYMVKNSYQNKASYNSEVYQVIFNDFYLTTPESLSGCTTAFPCGGVSTSYDTYKNNSNFKGKMTRFAYYYSSNSNYESSICLIFDTFDSAFCFYNNQNYVGVNGLTTNPAEFDTSLVGNSPRVSNSSAGNNEVNYGSGLEDYNYIDISDNDLVSYFENSPGYKFNKNICKVGTTDFSTLLSSVYNSGGVSFSAGLGSDIFEFYSSLYGSSFNISEIGSFLNVWRNNYGTVFMTSASDRLYRMIYNGNGTVSLEYDNLDINRFMSIPYVYYTMGQISYTFGNMSSIGEEIATYCYYKLGYDSNSDYNIIDDHDSSYDSSAGNFINNYKKYHIYQSGSTNIVSQSWEGTPLDYFTGDDNLEFDSFFSKSFNKFKDSFTINNQDLGAGFLPTYIIMFLLAIILFKFISH